MRTVGVATVAAGGDDGAGTPVGGWFVTAPRPVQKIETYSPGCAGRAAEASIAVLAITTAPCGSPVEGMKITGAAATVIGSGELERMPTTDFSDWAPSQGICTFICPGDAKRIGTGVPVSVWI